MCFIFIRGRAGGGGLTAIMVHESRSILPYVMVLLCVGGGGGGGGRGGGARDRGRDGSLQYESSWTALTRASGPFRK
jgi:hypothetical protein